MFDTILDWARGNPLDIILIIVGTVLLSVINEEKQSRKGYFGILSGIAFVVLYFAFKYLTDFSGPSAPNSPSWGFSWGKFFGSVPILLLFGFLVFKASRPWNVAPPKIDRPVDTKGSTELHQDTPEEVKIRKREERYYHWPSIIGFTLLGLSLWNLLVLHIPSTKVTVASIALVPSSIALLGVLVVPFRRRWLLYFMEDVVRDRKNWLVRFSHVRTKCLREEDFELPDGSRDQLEVDRFKSKMESSGFFMDAGFNWVPLAGILILWTKIEGLYYEEQEVRFQTEQLPTRGEEELKRGEKPRDDDEDGAPDPYSAAGTRAIDQRVKQVFNEFPFVYINMSASDRQELVALNNRFIESYIAQELAFMHITRAMFYPFFRGGRRDRGLDITGVERTTIDNKTDVLCEDLDDGLQGYSGSGVRKYKVLDRNPDPRIQELQNRLTEAKLLEEVGKREGVAAGKKVVAEAQQLVEEFGCSFGEAAHYLIMRTRAERAQTQYVDGMADLAKGAAAFGAGRSGRS